MAVRLTRAWCRPVLTGVTLALALTACGSAAPADPGGPSSTPFRSVSPSTPSSSPTSSDLKADMRTQLANALRPVSPGNAGVVADPTTRLDVLDTPWLPGWQVVDVTRTRPPHPVRFAVGLSSSGEVEYLAGEPTSFDAMLQDARIRVGSGETTVSVAELYLDTTRTFETYSYRIAAVSDIEWRNDLSAADEAARDQVMSTYAKQVSAPRATPAGEGWTLTVWMVDGSTLVRHDLALAADGTVTDAPHVVATGLPTTITV